MSLTYGNCDSFTGIILCRGFGCRSIVCARGQGRARSHLTVLFSPVLVHLLIIVHVTTFGGHGYEQLACAMDASGIPVKFECVVLKTREKFDKSDVGDVTGTEGRDASGDERGKKPGRSLPCGEDKVPTSSFQHYLYVKSQCRPNVRTQHFLYGFSARKLSRLRCLSTTPWSRQTCIVCRFITYAKWNIALESGHSLDSPLHLNRNSSGLTPIRFPT